MYRRPESKPFKIGNYHIPKPLFYLSVATSAVGFTLLVKDWIGGEHLQPKISAKEKVVIITGANTGIGKETAMDLARREAIVYMACRDLPRCEEARKDIVLQSRNKYVYCRECDLASLKSIKKFVDQFKSEQKQLHILINNAGVMWTPNVKTKDGFEMQLGVNHLGHFFLTSLLINMLKESAPSRIVNVSSVAHKRGQINKEDLNSVKEFNATAAYAQSKLANILFTNTLATKLKGTNVTVNAVHPGLVSTEILRHTSYYKSWTAQHIVRPLLWPFIKSPKQGAFSVVYVALSPQLNNVTGEYFVDCQKSEVSEAAKDEKTAAWLWAVSEKWTNAKYNI